MKGGQSKSGGFSQTGGRVMVNYLHGTHSYNRASSPSPPYPTPEVTAHVYTDHTVQGQASSKAFNQRGIRLKPVRFQLHSSPSGA